MLMIFKFNNKFQKFYIPNLQLSAEVFQV